MNSLHKIMVIGAGLGVSNRIAELFPDAKPEKLMTEQDKIALQKADAKRQRRRQRNAASTGQEAGK